MEMTGEQLIPASQKDTWNALNDTEILKACVPGCESIEPTGEPQRIRSNLNNGLKSLPVRLRRDAA